MPKIRWSGCLLAAVLFLSAGAWAETADVREYTIVKGDTLWHISAVHLGNPFLWPALWKENPRIADPDRIYPGWTIKIPAAAGSGKKDRAAASPAAADRKPAASEADGAAAALKDQERRESSAACCERKPAAVPAADLYPGLKGVVLYDGTVVRGRILFLSAEIVVLRLPDGRTASYSFVKEVSHFVKN